MEGQFLEKIVRSLKEVEWLYDFPVTQVFTRNILSQFPKDWCTSFSQITLSDLNGIPEYKAQVHWPSSLKEFLENCKELSVSHWINVYQHEYVLRNSLYDVKLPQELTKGMSNKKKHEVTSMVKCVKELCKFTNSSRILDVGSGKGYVDSALHHALGVTVVGAESDKFRVVNAQKRQSKLTGSCEGIKHTNWVLHDDEATIEKAKEVVHELKNCEVICTCSLNSEGTENLTSQQDEKTKLSSESKETKSSSDDVKEICESAETSESVMLIGLHSCADLSPVMIKIFEHCSTLSSVLLFSCCYHKLQNIKEIEKDEYEKLEAAAPFGNRQVCVDSDFKYTKGVEIGYRNFPMSDTLKKIMKDNDFHLSIYGLRLAAQESGKRWLHHTEEDHKSHERNVVYRALLEFLCLEEKIELKKCRRRCARKSKFCSFSEYVNTAVENYEFIPIKSRNTVVSFSEPGKASDNLKARSGLPESDDCGVSVTQKERETVSGEFIRDKLKTYYTELEDMYYLIEPLTGLQLALQPVLEALILLDRLTYLKEAGFSNVWLKEVFDVAVSPRNVALIAVRE